MVYLSNYFIELYRRRAAERVALFTTYMVPAGCHVLQLVVAALRNLPSSWVQHVFFSLTIACQSDESSDFFLLLMHGLW